MKNNNYGDDASRIVSKSKIYGDDDKNVIPIASPHVHDHLHIEIKRSLIPHIVSAAGERDPFFHVRAEVHVRRGGHVAAQDPVLIHDCVRRK